MMLEVKKNQQIICFRGDVITSDQNLPPAPYNLVPCKGMKNVFLSRSFAEFAVHHEISQQFRIWVSFTSVPDETYFPRYTITSFS